jgi:hypothetical protein
MQAIIVSFHVLATSNGPDDDSMTLLMDHSTKHPTILGNPDKNSALHHYPHHLPILDLIGSTNFQFSLKSQLIITFF